VDLCSLLHRRYVDFIPGLIPALLKFFQPVAKGEEAAPAAKKRAVLRFLMELLICKAIDEKTKVIEVVESLMTVDIDLVHLDGPNKDNSFPNLSVVVSLLKSHGSLFLPEAPSKEEDAEEEAEEKEEAGKGEEDEVPPMPDVFSEDEQTRLLLSTEKYYEEVTSVLAKKYKKIKKAEKHNTKVVNERGTLTEEMLTEYDELKEAYDKLHGSASSLAILMLRELPFVEEEVEEVVEEAPTVLIAPATVKETFWETDEQRLFYEGLPEYRVLVPEVHDVHSDPNPNPNLNPNLNPNPNPNLNPNPEVLFADASEIAADEGEGVSNKKLIKYDELVARLASSLGNKEAVDKWGEEFCYINDKFLRRRLVRQLYEVPMAKSDRIPLGARLAAALHHKALFLDISQLLLDHLEKEKSSLLKEKRPSAASLQARKGNARYYAELVKFRVCSCEVVLDLLKDILDDFTGHNIEVACALIEGCGNFMYQGAGQETRKRISDLLDLVVKMKNAANIEERLDLMIDNAVITAKPPPKQKRVVVTRPPLHEYIMHLIYVKLGKPKGVEHAERQMRKLPWGEVLGFVVEVMTDCTRLKYNHIASVAKLLTRLVKYAPDLSVMVVDTVLENLRQGIEFNKWDHMQRRLTNMKLLGELFIFRLVDSHTVFDTLYSLITIGSTPGYASEIAKDAPKDFMRVRLVCTLLDATGQTFVKGATRRKLDTFLKYFMRYYLAKGELPIDVDFDIQDLFANLRPKMKRYESYDEACEAIEGMEAADNKSEKIKDKHDKRALAGSSARPVTAMGAIEEGDEEEDGDEVQEGEEEEEDSGEETEEEEEDEEELDEEAEEDEEEMVEEEEEEDEEEDAEAKAANAALLVEEEAAMFRRGEQSKQAREMEDSFDREFQAMMTESITQRKATEAPKSSLMGQGIPAHLRGMRPEMARSSGGDYDDESDEEAPQMTFQLLSRKGKGIATSELALPMDSRFAVRYQSQDEAMQKEREMMRDQVLAYEAQDDEDDDYGRGDPRGGGSWRQRGHGGGGHYKHGGKFNEHGPRLGAGAGGRGLLEFTRGGR